MVVPLTFEVPGLTGGYGAMICAIRSDAGPWPARLVSQVAIYHCSSARDPAQAAALAPLASPALAAQLRRVVVRAHEPGPACGIHLDGFCLQADG